MVDGIKLGRRRVRTVLALVAGLCIALPQIPSPGGEVGSGATLWVDAQQGAGSSNIPTSNAVSPDGSTVFVAGMVTVNNSNHYFTTAYDSVDGSKLWSRRHGKKTEDEYVYQEADAIVVSPDGKRLFVTGGVMNKRSDTDYGTVAYDADSGKRLWASSFRTEPGPWSDIGFAIDTSPDGSKVFVTGASSVYRRQLSGFDYHTATVAYSAKSGKRLWASHSDGSGQGNAIAASSDGSKVFVTGNWHKTKPGGSNSDYLTIAYKANSGKELWSRRFGGKGTEGGVAVVSSSDGMTAYVAGAGDRSAVVAYDAATGEETWKRTLRGGGSPAHVGGPLASLTPIGGASDLVLSPDGSSLFVVGGPSAFNAGAFDAASGEPQWSSSYAENGLHEAWGAAVTPDGSKLVVAGLSGKPGKWKSFDFLTVVFDALSGEQVWAEKYNSPQNNSDYGRVVSANPDGSAVYVSGMSRLKGDRYAATTVSYAP